MTNTMVYMGMAYHINDPRPEDEIKSDYALDIEGTMRAIKNKVNLIQIGERLVQKSIFHARGLATGLGGIKRTDDLEEGRKCLALLETLTETIADRQLDANTRPNSDYQHSQRKPWEDEEGNQLTPAQILTEQMDITGSLYCSSLSLREPDKIIEYFQRFRDLSKIAFAR